MSLKEYIKLLSLKRQNSILSASIVLGITFSLSAILGFLRSRFLYAHFFSCCVAQLDAYNAAFRLPDLIFKLLVTGALSASFIPVFSSYLHKDENEAYKLASNVINLLLVVFIGLSVFVAIFTRPLSQLIAGGFPPDQVDLMVNLTRILLIAQIFFLVSNFITGILQVHQIFLVPALAPIVYNVCIIGSILFLAPTMGIYGVTYGAVIGAFFHLAIQIPLVFKVGFRYHPSLSAGIKGVREIIKLMVPRSLSLGLGEIENTVTLFFATTLSAGSLSLLNLAMQVMYLPSRIFGTTVGQASLPILSKNIAKNELSLFRQTVKQTILQSLFIALPITAIILVHRVPLIRIIFGAKHFPWSATLTTARILVFLTPTIVCQAIVQIIVRSFYAMHNTKTPLYISIVSLVANVTTSYYLVNFTQLGVIGLAISASIGNLVQCIGLVILFSRIVDGDFLQAVILQSIKLLTATSLMISAMWFSTKILDLFILDTTKTINLIVLFTASTSIGLFTYFVFSKIFKVREINRLLSLASRIRPN